MCWRYCEKEYPDIPAAQPVLRCMMPTHPSYRAEEMGDHKGYQRYIRETEQGIEDAHGHLCDKNQEELNVNR
jgi:hypothetical protein